MIKLNSLIVRLIIPHIILSLTENLIRGLDDDEVDFLDIVDKAKMDAEKKQQMEENDELLDFRKRVASLQEKSLEDVSAGQSFKLCWTFN